MSGREGHDAMALQREYVMQLLGTVTGTLGETPAAASHDSGLDKRSIDGDDAPTGNRSTIDTDDRETTIVEEKRDLECQDSQRESRRGSKRHCSSESDNSDSESEDSDPGGTPSKVDERQSGWGTVPLEQSTDDSSCNDDLNDEALSQLLLCKKENKSKNPRASEVMEDLLKRAKEFSSQRVPITGSMFANITHENTEENCASENNVIQDQVFKGRGLIKTLQSSMVPVTPNKKCPLPSNKSNTSDQFEYMSSITNPVAVSKSSVSPVAKSVTVSERRDDIVADSSTFNLSNPLLLVDYHSHFTGANNYTKGCKWSPDGRVLLTLSADQHFRLWQLPAPLATPTFTRDAGALEHCPEARRPTLTLPEGELVYDYLWYPLMTQDDPASQAFVCCCRGLPVHMWDANTGELVCSYRPFNHLDELAPTSSLGFSRDGCQLVCGFNKCIRIFNTNRPGRQCSTICGKRQNGIISCFDFHPRLHSVLAAGSYLGSVGLYSTNTNKVCSLLEGHTGGLTQLTFSSDGYRLYTGARKDCELLCWDIRQLGRVLSSHGRTVETHQRVAFALSSDDATLITGSTDGVVSSWRAGDCSQSAGSPLPATQRFTAHDDCANGISLHPRYPVLATSSGQRRRPPHPDDASDPQEDRDELTIPRQSTVKLWWLGA